MLESWIQCRNRIYVPSSDNHFCDTHSTPELNTCLYTSGDTNPLQDAQRSRRAIITFAILGQGA